MDPTTKPERRSSCVAALPRGLWAVRLLALVVAVHVVIGAIDFRILDNHAGDFDRFWEIATTVGQPYRDYPVEYPPGAWAMFRLLAHDSHGREAFRDRLLMTNIAADGVILASLAWGGGAEAAACFGVLALPLFSLLGFHVDLWSVACTTFAVAAWQRDRPWLTAIGLFAGTALKLWPLPFAVLLLTSKDRRRALAPAAVFTVAMAAFGAGWWLLAGWSGFSEVLTFRGAHGWQVDSTIGSVVRLFEPSSIRIEDGAARVGRTNGAVSIAMFLLSALPSLWALWRGSRTGRVGDAWLAGVGAILLCSALLSPQFIGWLLPGAAMAWKRDLRGAPLIVIAIGVITALSLPPVFAVVRNVLILALVFVAARSLLEPYANRPQEAAAS